jgi:hypothetical protein
MDKSEKEVKLTLDETKYLIRSIGVNISSSFFKDMHKDINEWVSEYGYEKVADLICDQLLIESSVRIKGKSRLDIIIEYLNELK